MSNGEMREGQPAPPTPERAVERETAKENPKTPERPRAGAEAPGVEKQPLAVPAAAHAAAPAAAQGKDPALMKVERVLEQNLSDIYIALPPEARKKFKDKGEETASAIHKLIDSAKARARTVLHLIRDWLRLIPHVNRYFLDQEAKIKTDVIMAMAEEKKSKGL